VRASLYVRGVTVSMRARSATESPAGRRSSRAVTLLVGAFRVGAAWGAAERTDGAAWGCVSYSSASSYSACSTSPRYSPILRIALAMLTPDLPVLTLSTLLQ